MINAITNRTRIAAIAIKKVAFSVSPYITMKNIRAPKIMPEKDLKSQVPCSVPSL